MFVSLYIFPSIDRKKSLLKTRLEPRLLRRRITIGEARFPGTQVVSDVVGVEQLVIGIDSPIDECSDRLVQLPFFEMAQTSEFFARNRPTDRNVYTPLLLTNTGLNALQILSGLFFIAAVAPGEIDLPGLEQIARLYLIGDRNRCNVKFGESVDRIAIGAQREEFNQPLIGCIESVFRTSVALGDPDRTTAPHHIAQIAGKKMGMSQKLMPVSAPQHLEQLVRPADVGQELRREQIVAPAQNRARCRDGSKRKAPPLSGHAPNRRT